MNNNNFTVTYSDKKGEIKTEMTNNGSELRIKLDGIEFLSTNLGDFKTINTDKQNKRFDFDKYGTLTNYSLFVQFPIRIEINDCEKITTLDCKLKSTISSIGVNQTISDSKIQIANKIIEIGSFDLFESAFDRLNQKINSNIKLKCCSNCLYADYSVFGQDFWGTMLCFKNIKNEYLKVKHKGDYMNIMDNYTQQVQETHYCNEFEKRIDGTGYRG
jgi:hypothetical protein